MQLLRIFSWGLRDKRLRARFKPLYRQNSVEKFYVHAVRRWFQTADNARRPRKEAINWIILDVYINNERVELLFVNMFQDDNGYLSTHLKNSLPYCSWNICGENYEAGAEISLPLK